MKANLYKNIDLVRIPVKNGVAEYYLPQNVAWADQKVDQLVVLAPAMACVDPVDGTSAVMDASKIRDLYFDLYNADGLEILHDTGWEQLSHRNNHAIRIDAKLNLSLCKIYFATAPAADYTLLLYVVYGSEAREDYDYPSRSKTVVVPMAANEEISFRDIMSTYIAEIPQTLKGVLVWSAETDPAYITLRDYTLTHNLYNLHTELMRPDMNTGTADGDQIAPFLLDGLNIDFKYSSVRNAQNAGCIQQITFLY